MPVLICTGPALELPHPTRKDSAAATAAATSAGSCPVVGSDGGWGREDEDDDEDEDVEGVVGVDVVGFVGAVGEGVDVVGAVFLGVAFFFEVLLAGALSPTALTPLLERELVRGGIL
jgi:hypothetical protein